MPGAINKHARQALLCISLITMPFEKINAVHHLSSMKLNAIWAQRKMQTFRNRSLDPVVGDVAQEYVAQCTRCLREKRYSHR